MTQAELRDIQNVSAVLYAIVIATTSYRLVLRARTRTWWWDDSFSLMSMLTMVFFIVGAHLIGPQLVIEKHGPDEVPNQRDHFGYWLLILGYYNPVWSARLSTLFTTIRFAPRQGRRPLNYLVFFFLLEWALLLIQGFASSQAEHWKGLDIRPEAIAIYQLTSSIVSDGLLIIAPIWIIRNVQLDPKLKSRLMSLFSISVFTAAMGIVPFVLSRRHDYLGTILFAFVQVFISSTVCNAFVILLMITVGRHVNRDELIGTSLSTFIYDDVESSRSPIDVDSGGGGGGVRGRKIAD